MNFIPSDNRQDDGIVRPVYFIINTRQSFFGFLKLPIGARLYRSYAGYRRYSDNYYGLSLRGNELLRLR